MLQAGKIRRIKPVCYCHKLFRDQFGMLLSCMFRQRIRNRKYNIRLLHDTADQARFNKVRHPISKKGKLIVKRPRITKIRYPSDSCETLERQSNQRTCKRGSGGNQMGDLLLANKTTPPPDGRNEPAEFLVWSAHTVQNPSLQQYGHFLLGRGHNLLIKSTHCSCEFLASPFRSRTLFSIAPIN